MVSPRGGLHMMSTNGHAMAAKGVGQEERVHLWVQAPPAQGMKVRAAGERLWYVSQLEEELAYVLSASRWE